jgi:hypothetical protein
MFVAAISAFHRFLLNKQAGENVPVVIAPVRETKPWLRGLRPIRLPGIPIPEFNAPGPAGSMASKMTGPISVPLMRPALAGSGEVPRTLAWQNESSLEEKLRKKFLWNRLGLLDLVITLALTYGAILYWEHLIATM